MSTYNRHAAPSSTAAGSFCNNCGTDLRWVTTFRLTLDQQSGLAKHYCAPCAERLVRCASCGRSLGARPHERIYMLPGDEPHIYCDSCWSRPHCQACGRPVGATSFARPDGRVLCQACHATAVYTEAEAGELYRRVVGTLIEKLGLDLSVGANFHMVSREQMAQLRGASTASPEISGADYVGLFVHYGHLRAIYVEYGLPRILFCEVVAHEYAHVWQAENCPLLRDPVVREGYAEWVAYKLLESWGATRRMERFRERRDLYGDGLRLVLERERRSGVEGVMRLVRGDV